MLRGRSLLRTWPARTSWVTWGGRLAVQTGAVDYPQLTSEQAEQLAGVETSTDGLAVYAPCQVTLTSGEVVDHVYVMEAGNYMRSWGVDPRDDPAKRAVAIERVTFIQSSPTRLPARFANDIYAAGESGMGYTVFTVVVRGGRQLPFVAGNAVDFPAWPTDIDPSGVTHVLTHVGRDNFKDRSPRSNEQMANYHWCLFSR